jgi:hypothetical protein
LPPRTLKAATYQSFLEEGQATQEIIMQGLIFNLLEEAADDAGCSDEAWELVVEFAAAEGLPSWGRGERQGLLDAHPPRIFEIPAEAMLRCLARERSERPLSTAEWDFFELQPDSIAWSAEAAGNQREPEPPEFHAELRAPYCGGAGAFAERAPSVTDDTDGDQGLEKAYRLFGLGPVKQ